MSERSDKLGLESRISTVFTMLLTAMSVMRVAKTFLELGIDSLLIRRAERTQSELPADVARRKVILEEKFITTALAGARAEGGGGGGKGLAAGSGSRRAGSRRSGAACRRRVRVWPRQRRLGWR